MDDGGVCQPRRPGVKFLAVRDGERQVIQAGARLVERVLAAMPVLGEPQADLQAVVPEKHLAACPVRRRQLTRAVKAEHFPVPSRTRVNVTNRQPEVMDAPDHGLLTVSLPRTASRRQVLRCTRCPGRPAWMPSSVTSQIISSRCRKTPQSLLTKDARLKGPAA